MRCVFTAAGRGGGKGMTFRVCARARACVFFSFFVLVYLLPYVCPVDSVPPPPLSPHPSAPLAPLSPFAPLPDGAAA